MVSKGRVMKPISESEVSQTFEVQFKILAHLQIWNWQHISNLCAMPYFSVIPLDIISPYFYSVRSIVTIIHCSHMNGGRINAKQGLFEKWPLSFIDAWGKIFLKEAESSFCLFTILYFKKIQFSIAGVISSGNNAKPTFANFCKLLAMMVWNEQICGQFKYNHFWISCMI